uniref:Inorganic phosphate cotransporter n=1 Tax=Cacopsylla melanoneura TaxID=428564 RepID=A0A8D8ZMV9_9HEMI
MDNHNTEKKDLDMLDKPDYFIPQRYVLGILGFLAFALTYVQRFCLSIAITEMAHVEHKISNKTLQCPGPVFIKNQTIIKHYEFDWDEQTQGLILSSFFWGYVLNHLPGALIAERYGGKYVLGFGLFLSTIATLVTPLAARAFGAWGIIVARFIVGVGQGPAYPSMNVLLAQWVPKTERGRLGALVFAGAQIGNVLSMAVSGLLIRYLGGWTSVFYVFGACGLAWFCLWMSLAYNDPSQNPHLSEYERKYLLATMGHLKQKTKQDLPPTPWGKIATSGPVIGLIIAQIGHDFGLFTIITDLPKYMADVLHFSITSNGILSALPLMMMWVMAILSGWIVDLLISKKNWSVTFVRKLFVTIASIGPGLGILAASYSGCNRYAVTTSFTLGMGLMGAFLPSLKVNALDLSPNYVGTLMALVGGIGALSGTVSPYLVGVLTPNSTITEWRVVFWIAFFVLTSTNLIYCFMGSGDVQEWNEPLSMKEKKEPCLEDNNNISAKENGEQTKYNAELTKYKTPL